MSAEVRVLLAEVAPRPTRRLDPAAIQRRGNRIRFVRRVAAVVLAVPMLTGLGWGATHADLFVPTDQRPAGSPGVACPSARGSLAVFLVDGATPEQVSSLKERLLATPHVVSVTYVSHHEAFLEFKKLHAGKPGFWTTLAPDALPASLRVVVDDYDHEEEVATGLYPWTPPIADVKMAGAGDISACLADRLTRIRRRLDALLLREVNAKETARSQASSEAQRAELRRLEKALQRVLDDIQSER